MTQPVNAPLLSSASFDDNGDLVFTNADGTTLTPIAIPAASDLFIDNGDSTWGLS